MLTEVAVVPSPLAVDALELVDTPALVKAPTLVKALIPMFQVTRKVGAVTLPIYLTIISKYLNGVVVCCPEFCDYT